jgi:hypothetical protein
LPEPPIAGDLAISIHVAIRDLQLVGRPVGDAIELRRVTVSFIQTITRKSWIISTGACLAPLTHFKAKSGSITKMDILFGPSAACR